MTTTTAYLASTGTALPGPAVGNADLGKVLGVGDTWEEWIDAFVGIESRHFARDLGSGEVLYSLTDLCAEAAGRALAGCELDPSDVDFVVLSTATPDSLLPTTAGLVAERLRLDHLPVYQVQAGCAGAVQSFELAGALIAAGHRTGLVIGGDVSTRHLDLGGDPLSLPTQELVNYVLFGDGAGAAVLTAEPVGAQVAVRRILHRMVGLDRPAGQTVGWYGIGDLDRERELVAEDYKAIEENVPVMSAEVLWELMDGLGWQPGDVDYLLPPQLSGRMTRRIVDRLAVPHMADVSCVARTGNTGNALPFHQLAELLDRMTGGQRAVAVTVESSKWIKGGLALEKL